MIIPGSANGRLNPFQYVCMGIRLSTSLGLIDGSTAWPQFFIEVIFIVFNIELICIVFHIELIFIVFHTTLI